VLEIVIVHFEIGITHAEIQVVILE
jgi:hypothetical protein